MVENKFVRLFLLGCFFLVWSLESVSAFSTSQIQQLPRQRENFNDEWRFFLGDDPEASLYSYDDSRWESLQLPHDWSICGEFSDKHPAGAGGGALPGGIGWYRKLFFIDADNRSKLFFVEFDGVYMNSEVFINGVSLGVRPNGYIGFEYNITPYLKFGEKNVIAVKVDNSDQPNSRWYSGSGIYRNVWLKSVNTVHVAQWGTYVTTPIVRDDYAQVKISTTINNIELSRSNVLIESIIKTENGDIVGKSISKVKFDGQASLTDEVKIDILDPQLWSIESPNQYVLQTTLQCKGVVVDNYQTNFGVRTIYFDSKKGFFLNGEPIKIKGVCMHHDLGCLGAAVNVRAIERQLEILKEMGCNSIRCSHNPPAPEVLELCDKMGLVVMDETFDMWRKRKTKFDYARYFDEWYERDLTDIIKRDRNHPSIIMWCIGNEVLEQWTHADADTLSLQEANLILNAKRDAKMLEVDSKEGMSFNSLLTQQLASIVRKLDPTRPITAGCNEADPDNHLFRSGALDIIGYNYQDRWFLDVPNNFPETPFIITESTSGLMTRGYYRMPSDSMYIWPERWDKPFYDPSLSCSSYDNCHVPWGTTHEKSWLLAKENDFISGLYVWTGFDYIGEPTPYNYPARSSHFGIVDLAGFPKDIYYMYQSEWSDKEVLHIFPHWNWQRGDVVDIWAYFNNADEVELFVNDISQGVKRKEGKLHVSWRLDYEPGVVRAVSRRNGDIVAEKEIYTASEVSQIRLTADRANLYADGVDLSFVTVELLDENGNIVPTADDLVEFSVDGVAFIAGVDNGNPVSHESFKRPYRKAFNGKCLVVLQSNGEIGDVTLEASVNGVCKSSIQLKYR